MNETVMRSNFDLSERDEDIVRALIGGLDVSDLSVIERIELIEDAILKCKQVDIPVTHSFADGLYMREILIPKGTLLTSKVHRYEQFDLMPFGDISIVTNEGIVRIKGPFRGISPPRMKRLGYAHEDTLWITVHATRETNVELLEKTLFVDSFEELESCEEDLICQQ